MKVHHQNTLEHTKSHAKLRKFSGGSNIPDLCLLGALSADTEEVKKKGGNEGKVEV